MNLYYLNRAVNSLREHAHTNMYACWRLGELLHEADMMGLLILQDKSTGIITITKKKGGM